jgi:putative flippase GtrA
MTRLASLRTFMRYAGVGVANTAVDFAVFALLLELGVAAGFANAFGFMAGAINSYVCNTLFTFRDAETVDASGQMRRLVAFAAVTLIGLAVSAIVFAVFHALVADYLAKLAATLAVLSVGYLLNRTLVFAPRRASC